MFKQDSIIVKQSPIVIIKNFILFELAAVAAFFVAAASANYVAIYRTLFFSRSIPFHIAELLFIIIFQTVLIFYIFLRWYKQYYNIRHDSVVHGWGIIFKHLEVVPFSAFSRVNYHNGPLAKILKYGTVELVGPRTTRLVHIPDPQKYGDTIIHLKKVATGQTHSNSNHPHDINTLINQPETGNLEFKSSFRWDFKENKVNRGLEKAIMKTVAAFLNSQGGQIVIGVDDKKNIVGTQHDYQTLPHPDADSFENHFSQVFHSMVGPEFRQFVELSCHKVQDKEVCLVSVRPSQKPVYLKSDGSEEFYIRTGNKTTSLRFSEATSYIDSRRQGLFL